MQLGHGHTWSLAYKPSGQSIAVGCCDGHICIVDPDVGEICSQMQLGKPAPKSSDLMLPVASPPVMCCICGEGFTHAKALVRNCKERHGDYAEYRQLLF